MRKNQFVPLLFGFAVLIASCGKKSPAYTRHIPKDAGNVIAIDVKSILTKLKTDSLSIENIMSITKDSNNANAYASILLKYNEFKDAGIDWESKVYLAVSSTTVGYRNSFSLQLLASMEDEKKFEAFLKKQPMGGDIKKGDGYSYTGNDEYAIGWNSDVVMILKEDRAKRYDNYIVEDTTTVSKPKSETTTDGPAEKLKKYFKMEKNESIASIDGFNDLQGKKADISFFNQVNMNGLNGMSLAFLPKLKELIEGSYSSTTINFEDGKAVIASNSFPGKKMAEILKKYTGPEVDLGMIENYPSKNINGIMTFSFKPELIPALIKESGLDALIGLGLIQTGITLDDFGKIFKGNFALVVSDFAMETKEMNNYGYTYKTTVPTAKLLFTAKIADKTLFNKLIDFGQKQGAIIRNGDRLIPAENGKPMEKAPVVISTAGDMLTLVTDSSILTEYQNKTQKIGLSEDVKSKLKGNAVAAFFDVTQTLNGIKPNLFDSTDQMAYDIVTKAKATFKSGYLTSTNFNGKSIEGKAEIIFTDDKKNSLAQLVRFIMYAAEVQMKLKEYNKSRWEKELSNVDDSTVTTIKPVIPDAPRH